MNRIELRKLFLRSTLTFSRMLSLTQVIHLLHGCNLKTRESGRDNAESVLGTLTIPTRDVSQALDSVFASSQFVPNASLDLYIETHAINAEDL